jgi:hypothetical protein
MPITIKIDELIALRDELTKRLADIDTAIRVGTALAAPCPYVLISEVNNAATSEGNGTEAPRKRRGRPPRAQKAAAPTATPTGKRAPGELSERVLAAVGGGASKAKSPNVASQRGLTMWARPRYASPHRAAYRKRWHLPRSSRLNAKPANEGQLALSHTNLLAR